MASFLLPPFAVSSPRSAPARLPSQPPSFACDRGAPSDVTGTGTFHWPISIVAGYLNCRNSRSSGGLLASFRGRPRPSTPGSSCVRLSQSPRYYKVPSGRAGWLGLRRAGTAGVFLGWPAGRSARCLAPG
ncbi:uncharacterized protein ACBT57_023800 [Dama dama]